MSKSIVHKDDIQLIKIMEGIYRKTLIYNDDLMLCLFILEKGAEIPMHNHKEHQVGYVIKGKIKFYTENSEFIANQGDAYIFDSFEKHAALIMEKSEVIDVFNPSREDYK